MANDGLPAALEALRAEVERSGASAVFGHGLAVPLVLSLEGVTRVITNGPIARLDPFAAALASIPQFALSELLRPTAFQAWLRSSAGLRRAVANPYVMDRDTVAMLTDPVLGSRVSRSGAARWLRELPDWLDEGHISLDGVVALWGDADPLYPIDPVLEAIDGAPGARLRVIEGGRHLHPEERPWAVSDLLADALSVADS